MSRSYEGCVGGSDGTRYFLFGYMNRNWEEELDVPVGPENGFSPGPVDQGQPTHFLPRRNRFVFRVKVPANFFTLASTAACALPRTWKAFITTFITVGFDMSFMTRGSLISFIPRSMSRFLRSMAALFPRASRSVKAVADGDARGY